MTQGLLAPLPPQAAAMRPMSGRLQDKIVTGAARGIGAAIARLFAQHGAQVIGIDPPGEPAPAVAQPQGCLERDACGIAVDAGARRRRDRQHRREQTELLPCKRIGTPVDVACTALFLASDEARFINATDILVDGGRSQLYHD